MESQVNKIINDNIDKQEFAYNEGNRPTMLFINGNQIIND